MSYHQGLLTRPSLNWVQWWALCYHMNFTHRSEAEKRSQFVETITRNATRIFRPEIYDKIFPPTLIEQALRIGEEPEEEIGPEDFDSIDQFIHGLGDLRSASIPDDEGWV